MKRSPGAGEKINSTSIGVMKALSRKVSFHQQGVCSNSHAVGTGQFFLIT